MISITILSTYHMYSITQCCTPLHASRSTCSVICFTKMLRARRLLQIATRGYPCNTITSALLKPRIMFHFVFLSRIVLPGTTSSCFQSTVLQHHTSRSRVKRPCVGGNLGLDTILQLGNSACFHLSFIC